MLNDLIDKIKKILLEPDRFFKTLKEKGWTKAYKFFAIMFLFSTVC